jgi:hypothetical protein
MNSVYLYEGETQIPSSPENEAKFLKLNIECKRLNKKIVLLRQFFLLSEHDTVGDDEKDIINLYKSYSPNMIGSKSKIDYETCENPK